MSRARALGLAAVCTIAPLGALAGTVAACGGAAPVKPYPYQQSPGTQPPPIETIAPPAPVGSDAGPEPQADDDDEAKPAQ